MRRNCNFFVVVGQPFLCRHKKCVRSFKSYFNIYYQQKLKFNANNVAIDVKLIIVVKFNIYLQLVQQFGLEADRHYLRCLFSSIDFGDVQAAKSSSQAKLLSNELTALLDKPSLISNICYAFDNQINDSKVTFWFFLFERSFNICLLLESVS